MKYAYDEASGNVLGLNRGAQEGETEGTCTPQELVWGMDHNKYKVVAAVLTPLTEAEVEAIDLAAVKATNSGKAKAAQDASIAELEAEEVRVKYALPATMSDEDKVVREEHIQLMQGEADNPTEDVAYNPPLPPGVTPPVYESLTVTVTREPGWNDVLGWRAVITSKSDDFVPGNLAMSVHNGANCEGYPSGCQMCHCRLTFLTACCHFLG